MPIVTVARRPSSWARRDDQRCALESLLDGGTGVALLEGLGRREGDVHLLEGRLPQPLVAAFVEHEAGEDRRAVRRQRGGDLFGAFHLGHEVVADEARRLDARQAGRGEPVGELRARCGGQDVGLVLKAVARADVAQHHTRHGSPRSIG